MDFESCSRGSKKLSSNSNNFPPFSFPFLFHDPFSTRFQRISQRFLHLFIRHAILRRRIYLGFVVASGDGRPESSLHGQVSSRRQGRSRKKLVGPRFIISCCAKGREEFLGENRNRTTRLRALPYSSLRIYNKGWLGIMIHPVL